MAMQVRAWNNLPIHNVWQSAIRSGSVALHERVWGIGWSVLARAVRVERRWRTMESTVYGHPGQPKPARPARGVGELPAASSASLSPPGASRPRATRATQWEVGSRRSEVGEVGCAFARTSVIHRVRSRLRLRKIRQFALTPAPLPNPKGRGGDSKRERGDSTAGRPRPPRGEDGHAAAARASPMRARRALVADGLAVWRYHEPIEPPAIP
jgi:hypothetical protein